MRLRNRDVLLLNVDYSALETITWQRAIVLIVIGEAESVGDVEPQELVRSTNVSIPLPRTIRLLRYVHVEYRVVVLDEHSGATFPQILRRDKNRCAYCGEFASTVDHIMPQSRGGPNVWGNLIAACFSCNNMKADRTPEEAGMKLLWPPKVPRFDEIVQRTVWRELSKKEVS